MSYQFHTISWILLITTLISVLVALIAWQRRNRLVAKYLILLACGAAVWTFSYIFETAATDVSHVLLWAQISYLGVTTVPLSYFLLALAYGQHYKYLIPRNIILLSIVPLFTLLMVATHNWHHLWYTSISIDPNSNMPIYGYSIWFWLYVIYSYLLLVIGVILLFRTILSVPSIYKSQIIIIIIGAVLPFAGNIIYVFKINPVPGLDWTPIAFGLSGLFLTWGILGFQLLNLIPVARHKLVETMHNGVLVIDSQGIIVDYNPAMQVITGIPVKKAIGQKVIQVLANWKEFINCLNVKTDKRREICLKKGKAKYYYDLQVTLLYDNNNRSAGQVIMLRNITEQKQAEDALNVSEERFKQVAENAQEWIWEVNANGLYTYASPVVKDILGYNVDEIVGKKYFYDFFLENDREKLKTEALSIFAKKLSFKKFENINNHKSGKVVYLSTSGVPVMDSQGTLIAYRGSDTDITERKLAEETLRQSEEKYRTIIENIEDGYYEIDLAGNMIFFNESLLKLTGYSREEFKGMNNRDYMNKEDAKELFKHFNLVYKTGKSAQNISWRAKRKDGAERVAEASISLIHNSDGLPVGFRGIVRDQTDRIKAAENLKKSEEQYRSLSKELIVSNSMKELLLDVIVHDLKNPAGIIKGFTEIALENDPKNEILEEIDQGTDSLLKVIADATILSKITIGDTIEKEDLDLANIINVIIKEHSSLLQYEEMTLDMKIEELIVAANPIISEVFRNYISNAIKHAKVGKKVIIDAEYEDKFVVINVKDFGKTIEKKDRENIFMRKVQLDKSKGRGLGLAIVKRIAEAHNAEVGVKPNKPNGNNFYIKIPKY